MHSYGLLHLDINARNILISDDLDIILINYGFGIDEFAIENGLIGDFHFYPNNNNLIDEKLDL